MRTSTNNLLFLLLTFLLTRVCIGRNTGTDSIQIPKPYELFSLADSLIEHEGYKQAVEELRKYEKFYTDPGEKNMFFQVMMTYVSMEGNTKEMRKYESLVYGAATESYPFGDSLTARAAKDVILERCKDKQVVMMNEAHHRGQHRTFIRSLLRDFYKAGFRYLLVEAYFDSLDSTMNDRKYPTLKSGTYTREAAFGQMLREAMELGFTVASYDNDTTDCDSSEPYVCANQRERVAAENINNLLKKDPATKVLVAAGYDHIIKKSYDGWIRMAEQFQNLSGIRPFSIDLVGMSEGFCGYYGTTLTKFGVRSPVVLLNKTTGQPFLRNYQPEQMDLQVILPQTGYLNGYSDWLSDGYEKRYVVDLAGKKWKTGDLFQVYIKKEREAMGKLAVPFLQYPMGENALQQVYLPEKYEYQMIIDHGAHKTVIER